MTDLIYSRSVRIDTGPHTIRSTSKTVMTLLKIGLQRRVLHSNLVNNRRRGRQRWSGHPELEVNWDVCLLKF